MKRLIAVALCLAPIGCAATQPLTLAQLEANRERNVAAATRIYPGRSVADVKAAAFEVLRLLNPQEMKFDVRQDRILASQTFWLNLILSGSSGQRWYEVVFAEGDAGTRVVLNLEREVETGALIIPMKSSSFKQDIATNGDDKLLANYALFYDRLDYMLGLRTDWPTCSTYEKGLYSPGFFCGGMNGGIGVTDVTPPGPTPGPVKVTK
jgi:hypothetical protein